MPLADAPAVERHGQGAIAPLVAAHEGAVTARKRRRRHARQNARARLLGRADCQRAAREAVLIEVEQQVLRPLRMPRVQDEEQALAAAARRGGSCGPRGERRLEGVGPLQVAEVVGRRQRRHICM